MGQNQESSYYPPLSVQPLLFLVLSLACVWQAEQSWAGASPTPLDLVPEASRLTPHLKGSGENPAICHRETLCCQYFHLVF